MTSPLLGTGGDFPCKGYLQDLGTPAGAPTASWPAGSQQQLSLTGGAAHEGGSCQLSISYDSGKTFKVIKSIEGGCVNKAGGDQSFDFTVPADAKAGDAVFAWTWFNNTGNREMYMNCAAVTISGSGTNDLSGNPDMFVANVGNDCGTTEGTDVKFPNGGSDVQVISEAELAPPTGSCSAAAPAPAPAPPSNNDGGIDRGVTTPPPAAPPAADEGAAAPPPTGGQPPAGATYTVKSGDICTAIAAQNGVTVEQLLQNNPSVYVLASPPPTFLQLTVFFFSRTVTPVAPTSSLASPSTSAAAPASCASTTKRFTQKQHSLVNECSVNEISHDEGDVVVSIVKISKERRNDEALHPIQYEDEVAELSTSRVGWNINGEVFLLNVRMRVTRLSQSPLRAGARTHTEWHIQSVRSRY